MLNRLYPLFFSACLAVAPIVALQGKAAAAEPANVLLHNGERFLRMGNLGFAKANYDKLIANYEGTPEAAEAHGDLGVIAARQGDDDLAITEYEKAIAIADYPLAHFNLGQALLRKLNKSGAPEQWNAALKASALQHFQAFAAYLKSDRPRPPILTHSMPEVRAELDDALKRLR